MKQIQLGVSFLLDKNGLCGATFRQPEEGRKGIGGVLSVCPGGLAVVLNSCTTFEFHYTDLDCRGWSDCFFVVRRCFLTHFYTFTYIMGTPIVLEIAIGSF